MLLAQQVPTILMDCLNYGPVDRSSQQFTQLTVIESGGDGGGVGGVVDWRVLDAEVFIALSQLLDSAAAVPSSGSSPDPSDPYTPFDPYDSTPYGPAGGGSGGEDSGPDMPLMHMLRGKKNKGREVDSALVSRVEYERQHRVSRIISEKLGAHGDDMSDMPLARLLHLLSVVCRVSSRDTPRDTPHPPM